jgi:pyridinium-3,5-biscarboxylic acid mononucleotide sulfurtransferase
MTVVAVDHLYEMLDGLGGVAVAISGGVDSVTLAYAAHSRLGAAATMFHAVSPAVPPEATARTRQLAHQHGWRLEVVDAGEFADPRYLENPVNRCFFCKTNLYGTIARHSEATIVSGTNLDDLADYRPGLDAARDHRVRHPFVEARLDKVQVRALARRFGLDDVSRLPASPCLSSRVETGLRVTADVLGLVHAVESHLRERLQAATVRCRIRRDGLVVELDAQALAGIESAGDGAARATVERIARDRGHPQPVRFELYRMGSAFLRPA